MIIVVLIWLSSKGTFMFLDSVVHDRAEIAKPWREYTKEANSFFIWRLAFIFISIVVFAGFAVFFFISAASLYDRGFDRVVPIGFGLGMGLVALLLILVISYISLFLKDFVAPLMYKHRISTAQAWRRFLELFGRYPFHFLGYGIIIFLLILLFIAAVIVAVLATCCIGGVLLVIPYIGTVVTLPVWYTFRAYSLEFLAQFGPESNLFPSPEPAPAPAAGDAAETAPKE